MWVPCVCLCVCVCVCGMFCNYRATEQKFEEVHSSIKRGDIVGVVGSPGMPQIVVATMMFLSGVLFLLIPFSLSLSVWLPVCLSLSLSLSLSLQARLRKGSSASFQGPSRY